MTLPETRYAKSGDVRIAYQVIGHGPLDLVFVPGFMSNLEVQWEDPGFTHLLNRLSAFTRLILLDKRGTGLSDRVDNHHLPTLETRMDDLRAVMDAVGSGRAALLGASEGGPMSILFAATYPQRTRALVLYGSYAHFHTWVMDRDALESFIRGIEGSWGTGASAPLFAPDQSKDGRFPAWWGRFERLSASPSAAVTLARMNAAIDIRSVLASVRVPTLVIHRRDDARIKFAGGRYLAEKIAGARFVELPGRDHPIWAGEIDLVVDEIEEFLTGTRLRAAAGEIYVSGVVTDLVAGAGLHFSERGSAPIEGIEGGLRLLAVVTEQHLEPIARPGDAASLNTLSAREREVLTLVADGLSNAAIAERLHLSDHTVKRHVANILLKLDLPTRAAAAAMIGRNRPSRGL